MQISALTANGPAAIVRGQKLIRIPATLDFAPVPGWTARKVTRPAGNGPGGKIWMTTYSITACPLFVRTPARNSSPAMLTEAQNEWFLRKTKRGRFD